jgi:hypothetical protein
MTAGEEIQLQVFENLLDREGKTLTLTRRSGSEDVETEIEALIRVNGADSERPGVDFSSREFVEVWIANDAITPNVSAQETLTGEGKAYRVQKRFDGPIKTVLICKVSEVAA